jgi:hypothetical protein
VDFALAITITVWRPLENAVANCRMGHIASIIALPFVCVQDHSGRRGTLGYESTAGRPIRVIADSKALLAPIMCYRHSHPGRSFTLEAVPQGVDTLPRQP